MIMMKSKDSHSPGTGNAPANRSSRRRAGKKRNSHTLFSKEISLKDYGIAYRSRMTSVIGRQEVFSGKAKFGIFGDGKEVAQIAMAHAFQKGDYRSGYYRDQTLMFALGLLALEEFFAQLYGHADLGWDNMVTQLSVHRGERAFNPVHEDSYGWWWVVWMIVHFAVAALCWAPEVSRALTARDPKTTKRTFLFGSPGQFVRLALPALLAIGAFCYISKDAALADYFFPKGLSGDPSHADQAMPLVLGKIIPAGLLGLLVAGPMAAFMSTHDSYFLCWSSVIARDVIAPLKKRPLSDAEQIRITRIAIVCIGVFLLIWGIWYELPASVWEYMAVTGNIYMCGSIVALVGGMYWRRASNAGAVAALLGGLLSIILLFLPKELRNDTVIKAVFSLGNYVVCILLFVVFSLILPNKPRPREA